MKCSADAEAEQKLDCLQRSDQFRTWQSLEDERYCLVCGVKFQGWDIRWDSARDSVHCPTPECSSVPMDWAVPQARLLGVS